MSSDTILITGGTGFAGSHLIEQLLQSNSAENIHATHVTEVPTEVLQLLPEKNFHEVDLTNDLATTELMNSVQPTQIYHLAAIASAGDSFEKGKQTMTNNIALQLTVLEAVKNIVPTAKLLSISSADGYGVSENEDEIPITESHPFRPVNPYAVSKVSQELLGYAYHQSYDLQVVTVRPFNHIGERQTPNFAVPAFAKQIVAIERGQQEKLLVGSLDGIRDFTDVKDVVRAYELVMNQGKPGEVYNIGRGQGCKMSEVVDKLVALSSADITIETDQSRVRPLDIPVIIANNEKISQLGWQPTISLDNSLQRVLEYWRSQ